MLLIEIESIPANSTTLEVFMKSVLSTEKYKYLHVNTLTVEGRTTVVTYRLVSKQSVMSREV